MEYLLNGLSFILIWIFTVSSVVAHYCVWGLCESWEYCCDENLCCTYDDYNVWIAVIIIAGVVIGMIFAGICLYYNFQRIYVYLRQRCYSINSVPIPSEFESDVKI
ncbi:uncharacterized protein LOC116853693 isoform X2 [Odontomachus brunneus]|uniref:uncharacterized protein LOC116853693 isoform X2 n=1 Tax=Odontomachus brunneus TaxID=486640 RepID=UPI0013F21C39|nr:uncharacterized protein LOC116853693 isoform X2 [Odontomachus brunneus]